MIAELFTRVKTMLGFGPARPDKPVFTPPYDVPKKYIQRIPRELRPLDKSKDKSKGKP